MRPLTRIVQARNCARQSNPTSPRWGEVDNAQPIDLVFRALERANIGFCGLAKPGRCT